MNKKYMLGVEPVTAFQFSDFDGVVFDDFKERAIIGGVEDYFVDNGVDCSKGFLMPDGGMVLLKSGDWVVCFTDSVGDFLILNDHAFCELCTRAGVK
jgi:hypothetical protein